MKCSAEMAKKIEKLAKLYSEADSLHAEIKEYFEKELGAEGFGCPFITDKPTGKELNGEESAGEYCDQRQIGEDSYNGYYYHQIENSEKWAGYDFWV